MSPREIAVRAIRSHGAMQKPRELTEFIKMLRARPEPVRNVLEIGGMRGGTMWAWAQIATGLLVCVDLFVLEGRMELAKGVDYGLIHGDSHRESTRARVPRVEYDLLFIDGDHSYAGVRRDFDLYAPLVRPGGVVAFHDVSVEQPARVRGEHDVVPYWNQVRALFEHREIFDATGERWGGIGVLEMPPATDTCQAALAAAEGMPPPSDAHRVPTVPCDDPCGRCGRQLVEGEDTYCAECAA